MKLNFETAAALIAGMCFLVLLIGNLKKGKDLIINLVLRTVTGIAMIQIINYLLNMGQYKVSVGMNAISLLTSAILGFPGVILLYGIEIYKFL